MKRILLGAITTVLIAGCAAPEWRRPGWNPGAEATTDGLTIALAQCRSWANGASPMPPPVSYMPEPAPTSYTTYGTMNSNGSFNATTYSNSSSFASKYNQGAALGDSMVAAMRAGEVGKLTAACMRQTGWIDASTPEGKAKLEAATAAIKKPQ